MKQEIPIKDLMDSFHTDEKNKGEDIVSSYIIAILNLRKRLRR